ncbi:MAG: YebC/PmpR family DNA-binding transcriptional regulator [Thermostichales cyanobacterium BF4_bins_65]
MSHSEWEVIKLKKAKVDSRKNAIYTRHARAIMVAARQGEPDPDANFALRAAIEKARQAGLPNENIERAIKKGAGLLEETDLEALQYEGYGPGGVAILMEILTDNRNRTASEVREAFSKVGCSLGETGCVSWMFDHKGVITLQGSLDEEALLLAAAEAGGEDVHFQDNSATVICDYRDLDQVGGSLRGQGWPVTDMQLLWIPNHRVQIDDVEVAKKVLWLMNRLEDLDDVQHCYANFEIQDQILQMIS